MIAGPLFETGSFCFYLLLLSLLVRADLPGQFLTGQ